MIAALVAAVVIGVLSYLVWQQRTSGEATRSAGTSSTEAATFEAKVSSFTTVGSGFDPDGAGWKTQTYTTPQFGNLKPGVGLVLDLGEPQNVTEVDFTTTTGGLTVELRSADEKPGRLADWDKVGSATTANGATALRAEGKHRYWMLWVTRLGAGNKAQIDQVQVRGTT